MTRTADGGGGSALGALAATLAPAAAPLDQAADDAADLLGFAAADEDRFALHTVAGRRGPGRPPGAPNKANRDLAKLLAARGYRHPLEFLAAIYSADTRELAAKLRGGAPDQIISFDQARSVLDLQLKAAREAALYVAQQMPKAVEVRTDQPRAIVVINELGGGSSSIDGAMSIHDPITLEHQPLSASAAAGSDGAGSDDAR